MKYVAYYRVSTKTQGASGLGLDAQGDCVVCRVEAQGGELIGEFTDVESGKNDFRPQLNAALDLAKKHNATLIIAKLDRLSRSVAFIMKLRDSGVKFEACDLPDFNTLTVGMFATFAQYEREKIAERTKAALDARRKDLGEWRKSNLSDAARATAFEMRMINRENNWDVQRAEGFAKMYLENIGNGGVKKSLRELAAYLNENGFKAAKGNEFTAMQVKRLLDRVALNLTYLTNK
jgi:DNA invertase Pin-like site-specific DNA recombinase